MRDFTQASTQSNHVCHNMPANVLEMLNRIHTTSINKMENKLTTITVMLAVLIENVCIYSSTILAHPNVATNRCAKWSNPCRMFIQGGGLHQTSHHCVTVKDLIPP